MDASASRLAAARGESVISLGQGLSGVAGDESLSIVAHSIHKQGLTAKQFAQLLKNKGFDGKNIELISCGAACDGFAQNLANALGKPVTASAFRVNAGSGLPQARLTPKGPLQGPYNYFTTFLPEGYFGK